MVEYINGNGDITSKSIIWHMYSQVGSLYHMVLFSVFWEVIILLTSFYNPQVHIVFMKTSPILFFCVLFEIAVILIVMKWYLIVVLICIPMIISDTEHLLMHFGFLYIISGEIAAQILSPYFILFFNLFLSFLIFNHCWNTLLY